MEKCFRHSRARFEITNNHNFKAYPHCVCVQRTQSNETLHSIQRQYEAVPDSEANTTILASPLGTTPTSAPIEYTHVFLYTKSEVSQSSVYN